MTTVSYIFSMVLQILMLVLGGYYTVISLVGCLFKKEPACKNPGTKTHKFAMVVAAHNEQAVIGNLIDSLNTLNKKLTADAAAARREAAESRRQSEELSKTVQNLTGRVAVGSVIKARGLKLEAYNASDKVTDRSSRVVRMIATLSLVENDLAESGPVRVYIRVKDPDGILLTNSSQRTFSVAGGEPMICTASREVDYQGKEVDLGIYINDIPLFAKGIYTVEAYTEQTKLGESELMLR